VKLLFDQNLSQKLPAGLGDLYPACAHVRDFGLERADDEAIWAFARERGFTIVSKDDDFHQRSFLYGPPPKVVWVRLGNCCTARIIARLREHAAAIRAFESDPQAAFLALS
jgi:predicted nuclease of predicted toxin-antitoxin system